MPLQRAKSRHAKGKSVSFSHQLGKNSNLFHFSHCKGRMPIIKTLVKATKLEKEKFTIPKSVQDAIPIQRIWPDGIFQVGSRFSKTFSFTDINYQIAGKEDKTAMFLDYSELLNALDSGASAKITINNRKSIKRNLRNPCCFL